jgi:hypothetical protein
MPSATSLMRGPAEAIWAQRLRLQAGLRDGTQKKRPVSAPHVRS